MDRDGLDPALLPKSARMVFVTPSHRFPTGAILSLSRAAWRCFNGPSGPAVSLWKTITMANFVMRSELLESICKVSMRKGE